MGLRILNLFLFKVFENGNFESVLVKFNKIPELSLKSRDSILKCRASLLASLATQNTECSNCLSQGSRDKDSMSEVVVDNLVISVSSVTRVLIRHRSKFFVEVFCARLSAKGLVQIDSMGSFAKSSRILSAVCLINRVEDSIGPYPDLSLSSSSSCPEMMQAFSLCVSKRATQPFSTFNFSFRSLRPGAFIWVLIMSRTFALLVLFLVADLIALLLSAASEHDTIFLQEPHC